jgi:branched-chain amino acid transport system substrate-binding protein
MSMKPFAALAGLTFLGASALATFSSAALAAGETIRIGMPANLTGDLSSLDGPMVSGAKLKAQQINAAGGVLGKMLELVIVDTRTDRATVAAEGKQLIARRPAAIVAYTDSDSVLTLGPLAQEAGIPFVTPGATSPKLPGEIGDALFLACFGDNVQAAAGAEFLHRTLRARTVYLLSDTTNVYTTLLSSYFKQAFARDGGTILLEDTYKADDVSIASQIARLLALPAKPDALYVAALPDDIGPLVKQLRAAGVNQPIVGGDGYDTPLLLGIGGAAANDVYFSTHVYMAEDGTDAVKAFYAAYKAAYGRAPENAFAGLGYDAVGLVAQAIAKAGAAEPTKIRATLATTENFAGITGTVSYRPGSRIPDKGVAIIGVKDGRLSLAAELTPSWVPAP